MRAAAIDAYGGPEALHEIEVPPEPFGPGDVRLQVTAVAVSPTDTGVRSGARDDKPVADPPGAVPGMDAAGVVVEVGAVQAFQQFGLQALDALAPGFVLNLVADLAQDAFAGS